MKLIRGDCIQYLDEIAPRIIVTDAPKSLLVFLVEYAEQHDCIFVNAYSRRWICGPNGEKNPFNYIDIITAVSSVGDTICDPCMGSGSIGIAALMCGRNFTGIEWKQDRIERARKRFRDFEDATPRNDKGGVCVELFKKSPV